MIGVDGRTGTDWEVVVDGFLRDFFRDSEVRCMNFIFRSVLDRSDIIGKDNKIEIRTTNEYFVFTKSPRARAGLLLLLFTFRKGQNSCWLYEGRNSEWIIVVLLWKKIHREKKD